MRMIWACPQMTFVLWADGVPMLSLMFVLSHHVLYQAFSLQTMDSFNLCSTYFVVLSYRSHLDSGRLAGRPLPCHLARKKWHRFV